MIQIKQGDQIVIKEGPLTLRTAVLNVNETHFAYRENSQMKTKSRDLSKLKAGVNIEVIPSTEAYSLKVN